VKYLLACGREIDTNKKDNKGKTARERSNQGKSKIGKEIV